MVGAPQIYAARVMHKRLFPRVNAFHYNVYYLALPLPATNLPSNRFVQFYPKDLGKRDGSDPTLWARNILAQHGLDDLTATITLITMPRVMGYVFNPVSFYLCRDAHNDLRAVICEVHNTFGEQHSYLCAHPDHRPIMGADWLHADKVFHVSPFLARDGSYRFRFAGGEDRLGIWIDYCAADGRRQLLTSLTGTLHPLTAQSLRAMAWRIPLVTLKSITLIHFQALRLWLKRIRYIPKPAQRAERVTTTKTDDAPLKPD